MKKVVITALIFVTIQVTGLVAVRTLSGVDKRDQEMKQSLPGDWKTVYEIVERSPRSYDCERLNYYLEEKFKHQVKMPPLTHEQAAFIASECRDEGYAYLCMAFAIEK